MEIPESGEQKITVEQSGQDKRLDKFLAEALSASSSRSAIKKLIDIQLVLVNDAPQKAHHKLKAGDIILIKPSSGTPKEIPLKPENIPLNIVYEDDSVLVVDKPAGIAAHPSPGVYSGTLVNALLYHCGRLSTGSEPDRPGIVHRLDKDTSGLMVVAKNDKAHRGIAGQFQSRSVKKKYTAFVKGVVELDNGTLDLPIGRHPSRRQKQAVRFSDSRQALTKYKVLKRFDDYTMVELTPSTGRMHQLRVHMTYIGHPILGDRVYGKGDDRIPRQALHACLLGFTHPATGKYMEFKSELPRDMQKLL